MSNYQGIFSMCNMHTDGSNFSLKYENAEHLIHLARTKEEHNILSYSVTIQTGNIVMLDSV